MRVITLIREEVAFRLAFIFQRDRQRFVAVTVHINPSSLYHTRDIEPEANLRLGRMLRLAISYSNGEQRFRL